MPRTPTPIPEIFTTSTAIAKIGGTWSQDQFNRAARDAESAGHITPQRLPNGTRMFVAAHLPIIERHLLDRQLASSRAPAISTAA